MWFSATKSWRWLFWRATCPLPSSRVNALFFPEFGFAFVWSKPSILTLVESKSLFFHFLVLSAVSKRFGLVLVLRVFLPILLFCVLVFCFDFSCFATAQCLRWYLLFWTIFSFSSLGVGEYWRSFLIWL